MKKIIVAITLILSFISLQACWRQVENALKPPAPNAQLIKVVIGNQDSIWSLWNVCINNCRHAIAKWNGTEWELLRIPIALQEVVDITVTPEGELYILEDYDRKAFQYAQAKNSGKSILDILSDRRYKVRQKLHIYDGVSLKTKNISNTLSCGLHYGTNNAIYLKTNTPTIWYRFNNGLNLEYHPTTCKSIITHNDRTYFQLINKDNDSIVFRTTDQEIFSMNLSSAGIINGCVPWQITSTHLYIALQTKVGKAIVLAVDVTTKETTSLPYLPCALKRSNGLITHPQICFGYDNTMWAHGCNNAMYEWTNQS